MIIIKDSSMKIKRLLDCADTYVDDAALFQSTEPEASLAYAKVAEQLLSIVMDIHAVSVKAINKKRAEMTEPVSPQMQQMYDEEHKYLIDKHAMISSKIKMIKGMM